MATRNIVPRATGEGGLGTAAKKWALGWINALVVTTINALTLTAQAIGFTLSGGTTSKTLTVDQTLTLSRLVLVDNLKPSVNASVNKLDIFTKSGGAVPDATNIISVAIPDGNGYTFRSRAAAYLSGTSQFILADAANYWSKGSLDAEIKTAYIYAIWDGTGIIWALGGYSGFTRVPASTTATDDDFFLLEEGSTYTKAVTEYCVCVGKIRYQYDTADTPDHTIQATVLDAPQVVWNPNSDYVKSVSLATTVTSGSDIAEYSVLSIVVKQSGNYLVTVAGHGINTYSAFLIYLFIKYGSATYANAVYAFKTVCQVPAGNTEGMRICMVRVNVGDTIHFGISVAATSSDRVIAGDDYAGNPFLKATSLIIQRMN